MTAKKARMTRAVREAREAALSSVETIWSAGNRAFVESFSSSGTLDHSLRDLVRRFDNAALPRYRTVMAIALAAHHHPVGLDFLLRTGVRLPDAVVSESCRYAMENIGELRAMGRRPTFVHKAVGGPKGYGRR